MALVDTAQFYWPAVVLSSYHLANSPTVDLLIDAAGEKAAFVFQAPKTGTLGKVGFRTGTVTTGQTLKVSFQDLDANGNPDGTADQYRTVAVVDTDDNKYFLTGLITSDGTDGGTKRAVTKGDILAAVIEFDSTAGNLNIRASRLVMQFIQYGLYGDQYTAAWAKQSSFGGFYIEYDDGTAAFIPEAVGGSNIGGIYFNDGSASDEYGTRLDVPVPMRAIGIYAMLDFLVDAAAGACTLKLYNQADALLWSEALDSAKRYGDWPGYLVRLFSSPIELAIGTYRITARSTNATNRVGVFEHLFESAAQKTQFPYSGVQLTKRANDVGPWTDVPLEVVFAGLIIDQLDNGAGGGGGGLLVHPGMAGGMRG